MYKVCVSCGVCERAPLLCLSAKLLELAGGATAARLAVSAAAAPSAAELPAAAAAAPAAPAAVAACRRIQDNYVTNFTPAAPCCNSR